MILQRLLLLALCLPASAGVIALAAPAPQPAPQQEEQQLGNLAAVQAEILASARELAAFADSIKADVARDELYRCVMSYDSDDKDARKALGYTKSKGEWVFKKYTEPKSKAKDEDLTELQRRRTEASEAFEAKIEECFPSVDPTVRHKHELRTELEKMCLIDGANETLRQSAGFAWDEQKSEWRMREVVAAKLDRAERLGLLKELDSNVPVAKAIDVDPPGVETGVSWPVSVAVERVHVMCTGTAEEAQRMVSIVHRAPDFLSSVFGVPDPGVQFQWRVYDMADPALREQFYARLPDISGDRAAFATAGGVLINNRIISVASEAPVTRLDLAANQRVRFYLDTVFGAGLDKGWVGAGLGLFLSYQLCGTRLTLWINQDEYGTRKEGPKLGERLLDTEIDWLDEARILLRRKEDPVNIVAVLGKPVQQFTAEDLLASYAIGAYLYEGRRRDLVAILQRIGKGETPVTVFETQLEMPIDAFRERLILWLAEMRKG